MLTVRDGLHRQLTNSPYLRDALARGLINMSSLARELQPSIERELRKSVSLPSVLMALKRYSDELEEDAQAGASTETLGDLSLRANLVQITVANSERLTAIIGEVLLRARQDAGAFFVFTRSSSETSFLASSGLQGVVEKWLANERVLFRDDRLSAVSLTRTRSPNASGPSVLHVPLQALAWEGIEVLDTTSTRDEMTVVISDDDVDTAIAVLRKTLQPVSGAKR